MPRQSHAQALGNVGERWFAHQLPPTWIPQLPTKDVGVDALVVICDEGSLNGLEFRVQVKSASRWKVREDHILHKGFPRNSLLDLLRGFVPALLVFYEADSNTGYCFWLNQILARQPELLHGASKTVTIAMPMLRPIAPLIWPQLGAELRGVSNALGRRILNSGTLRAVLEATHTLTQSLYLIDLCANGRSDNEHMEDRVRAELTAHKEIVTSLRSLHSCFAAQGTAISGLDTLAETYVSICSSFAPRFESYVNEPTEGRQFQVVLDLMQQHRPEAVRFVTQVLYRLTDLSLRSATEEPSSDG